MKTEITDTGNVQVSTGDCTWSCSNPEQARKHLSTWTDQYRNGNVPSPVITQGDVSAISDCARDAAKQTKDTGAYKATQSWIYVNGEAIPTVVDGVKV